MAETAQQMFDVVQKAEEVRAKVKSQKEELRVTGAASPAEQELLLARQRELAALQEEEVLLRQQRIREVIQQIEDEQLEVKALQSGLKDVSDPSDKQEVQKQLTALRRELVALRQELAVLRQQVLLLMQERAGDRRPGLLEVLGFWPSRRRHHYTHLELAGKEQ